MLKQGSVSFHTAAKLLPQRLRDPITTFYAFCRLADDSIDYARDKVASLNKLKMRLDRCYENKPLAQPVDRAFADLILTHPIPRPLIDMLIEGFEWDTKERHYKTISDVRAYSVRVASTVGAIVALLLGVRDRDTIDRACSLGVAMQLTNIARDVGEDANANRLYLPTDWLEERGVKPDDFLLNPTADPAITDCIECLLEEAARWYEHAEAGIARLPRDARAGIFAARHIYADIGRVIRRMDYDSVNQRAIVTNRRKVALLFYSCVSAFRGQNSECVAGVPEAQGLVDMTTSAAQGAPPEPGLSDRIIWAAGLLARPKRRPSKRFVSEEVSGG